MGFSPEPRTVRVASGAATSQSVNADQDVLVGIYTPTAVDSGTFILESSYNDTTWFEIVMDAVTLAANKLIPIDPILTLGARYVRIKQSGNAGANRDYVCLLRTV